MTSDVPSNQIDTREVHCDHQIVPMNMDKLHANHLSPADDADTQLGERLPSPTQISLNRRGYLASSLGRSVV